MCWGLSSSGTGLITGQPGERQMNHQFAWHHCIFFVCNTCSSNVWQNRPTLCIRSSASVRVSLVAYVEAYTKNTTWVDDFRNEEWTRHEKTGISQVGLRGPFRESSWVCGIRTDNGGLDFCTTGMGSDWMIFSGAFLNIDMSMDQNSLWNVTNIHRFTKMRGWTSINSNIHRYP